MDGRIANDERQPIRVEAIASVPYFELWLLLHFEDVHAPIHRDGVIQKLKKHIPDYDKGQRGHWGATKDRWNSAAQRAAARAAVTTAHDGHEAFTDMHRLVDALVHLKD